MKKSEKEYQAIKAVLQESGIESATELQKKVDGMFKTAVVYSAIGALFAALFILVVPKYAIFIVMIVCLYLAWMWSSTLSSKAYFKRYLEEQATD